MSLATAAERSRQSEAVIQQDRALALPKGAVIISHQRANPPRCFGAVWHWLSMRDHGAETTRLGQGVNFAVRSTRPPPGRGRPVKKVAVVGTFFRRPVGQNQGGDGLEWSWLLARLRPGEAFSPWLSRRREGGVQSAGSWFPNCKARFLRSCASFSEVRRNPTASRCTLSVRSST